MNFQLVLNNNYYNCSKDIITDDLHETLHYYTNNILEQTSSKKTYRNFLFWRVGRTFVKSNVNSIVDKADAIGVESLNSIEIASALEQIGKQILNQVSNASFCKFYCHVVLIFNRAYPSSQQKKLKKLSTYILNNNYETELTPLYKTKDVFHYMLSFLNIKEHSALLFVSQDVKDTAHSILCKQNKSLRKLKNNRIEQQVKKNMYDILYHISAHISQEEIRLVKSQTIDKQIIFLVGVNKEGAFSNAYLFTECEELLSLYKTTSDFIFSIAFDENLLTSHAFVVDSEGPQFFRAVEVGRSETDLESNVKKIMDTMVSNLNTIINKLAGRSLESNYRNWIENIFLTLDEN